MNCKKKRIEKGCCILAVIMLAQLIFFYEGIPVSAEESIDAASDCVVEVDYLYTDEAGTSHLLKQSCGVLIGSDGNGASHVLAARTMVTLSEEELLQLYEQYQIPEDRQDRMSMSIQIVVAHDITVEASVAMESDSMNLVVLSLNQQIYNKAVAVFDLDESNASATESICTRGYEAGQTGQGVVIDAFHQDGISYIRHNIAVSGNEIGCPVMNSEDEVIGICLLPEVEGREQALNIKEAAAVLMTLGISYTAADHTDYSTDKSALETALQVTLFWDLSAYTEETAVSMNAAIAYAQTVAGDESATQETIDQAYAGLIAAQSGLMKEERLDGITIVMMIITGILLLLLCTIGIVYFIRKKKKKKEEKAREELEAKKAPKDQGPYIPDYRKKEQEVIQSMSGGNTSAPAEKPHKDNLYKNLDGFAPSSRKVRINTEDTTVLTEDTTVLTESSNVSSAFLINLQNGARISVSQMPFVIGKSEKKADYVLDNPAVSRAHARIIERQGNYYVIDLGSTNGTYIKDKRLESDKEYLLADNDTLKIADNEFRFQKS